MQIFSVYEKQNINLRLCFYVNIIAVCYHEIIITHFTKEVSIPVTPFKIFGNYKQQIN